MPTNAMHRDELAAVVGKAGRWPEVRKVREDQRPDVLQDASRESIKGIDSGSYDESRGSIEAWFRSILNRCIAKRLDRESKCREIHPDSIENEFAAVDPGMDRMEYYEYEAEVAKAAVDSYDDSSEGTRAVIRAINQVLVEAPTIDPDPGRVISAVADRLGASEGAVKAAMSRFGRKFAHLMGEDRPDSRINVSLIINITERTYSRMNVQGVFVGGGVSGGVVTGNVGGIDIDFEEYARHVRKVASAVEADRDVPAGVKADIVERLDDIEMEARSSVPRWDVLSGMVQQLASIFPDILKIASAVGVSLMK